MKTRRIETPNGRIAAHESAGREPAAVLLHGNSPSSRAFSRQLDGPLGKRFRLVALDLPGHGVSDDARDAALYALKSQAQTLKAAIDALGLADACRDAAPDMAPRIDVRAIRRSAGYDPGGVRRSLLLQRQDDPGVGTRRQAAKWPRADAPACNQGRPRRLAASAGHGVKA